VVRERGIVDSRRIAAATLIPPSAPYAGAEGDRGKVREYNPPFRSRAAGEEGGWGEGEGRHKFSITLSHSSRWLDARSTRRLQ